MVRWQPGARERLQQAALELFAARGYEQTTATEIAQAVGLTERTFFRHFSDKREVLFYGQQLLTDAFLAGLDEAPIEASPTDLVVSVLRSASTFFPDERRPYSRTRQSVIDQNPALQERESHKLTTLGARLADAFRARGIDGLTADVAARAAVMAFGVAFIQWIRDGEERSFADITVDVLGELATLTTGLEQPRHDTRRPISKNM
jgi:AcrR family transcriptional regulator